MTSTLTTNKQNLAFIDSRGFADFLGAVDYTVRKLPNDPTLVTIAESHLARVNRALASIHEHLAYDDALLADLNRRITVARAAEQAIATATSQTIAEHWDTNAEPADEDEVFAPFYEAARTVGTRMIALNDEQRDAIKTQTARTKRLRSLLNARALLERAMAR